MARSAKNSSADHARAPGERGLLAGGRAVWALAGVAVLALAAGFGLGRVVKSPAQAAGPQLEPGLITAKVEAKRIEATLVARADVSFADPIAVNPGALGDASAAVVTGRIPEQGSEVDGGDVILEVSGRPVFLLPGAFPAYRTLAAGSSGPDVTQLRAALNSLGFSAGAESDQYDSALAGAVKAMYDKAGYPAPNSQDRALSQAVRDARDAVEDAKDARASAQKAVDQAKQDVRDNVEGAQELLDAANDALKQAERGVTRAQEASEEANRAAWTPMISAEVVFATDLPRRVDSVGVTLGQDLSQGMPTDMMGGAPADALVLSGAQIKVTADVSAEEAVLLVEGGAVVLDPSMLAVEGVIESICGGEPIPSDPTQRCEVLINPTLSEDFDRSQLVGNVAVSILLGTSAEDSLVVPVAAVSANSAGEPQVELVVGELVKNAAAGQQETRKVVIEAGLSAQGFVEIKSSTEPIKSGDLVVVGVQAAKGPAAQSPEPAALPAIGAR
ncbi:MAG: peptidoglycan-binding protein [Bifidobacteriaceae bacterium]|nr:peptidoglycan-binding protein [Bifidobacteriaceae bacterium]